MKESRSLTSAEWRARIEKHRQRVAPFVEAHRARASRGEKHAVYDFLFQYYSFRPAQLEKWSAGCGVVLQDAGREPLFASVEYSHYGDDGVWLDGATLPQARRESARHIVTLLGKTAARPTFLGCFGLHEWAMLYRCEKARHAQLPLRLSENEIARVVEDGELRCTHFDAFRFFTPQAAPRNLLPLSRETQSDFEQPGCLHANMDLYKWAYKFFPFVGSDLIADAFHLALEARVLDMRATPYDLREYKLSPVKIETAEGRREYSELQRGIARKAQPLRQRLIAAYHAMNLVN